MRHIEERTKKNCLGSKLSAIHLLDGKPKIDDDQVYYLTDNGQFFHVLQ